MKALKSLLSLLLAAVLTLSLMPAVFAAEIDQDGDLADYVLHHNVPDDGYDGPNLQYFSPYITDYTYDGDPSYIQNNIFSLYNTVNGEVIPVYCTDIKVGALPDHRYRRLNLEDSTYAANAAGQLRAILRNGFYLLADPTESMDEHALRVAAKLKELGEAAGVEGLTIGEAISGTQSAIWQAAHGSRLEYQDFVRTIYTTKMPSAVKYYDLCNEERENGHIDYTVSAYGQVTLAEESDIRINARIKAVYDYLLSLAPLAPTQKTVSPASFVENEDPVYTLNADGTYDVSVTTTVDVHLTGSDYLNLSAIIDDAHQVSAPLSNGTQTVTLTMDNVPADLVNENVVLNIKGMQTASEVFIFDAYGNRETAQTMIGMDDSQLPVAASILATTNDRILNFYKTAVVAAGNGAYERHPLEGITFDVYLVAEMDAYLAGEVELPEATEYDYPAMSDFTVITDKNGRASINFTQQGKPDGVYLVVERDHPAIKAPVEPFYVFMPTTNAEGTGYDYEITVQPKNDVKGDVKIEKDVISLGNDSATVDAYTNHTWIIGTNIPEDIAKGKSFVISDTLDHRLDYMGSLKVNVETADGTTVVTTLTEGVDYILNVTDADSLAQGTPSDAFTVTLTTAGMGKVSTAVGADSFDDYMLRVYFDARINGNAEMGTQIPNQAEVKYTNSVNFDFSDESDKPVVYTGGANLLKVDSANDTRVLPGATFEVYRYATAEEVAAGSDAITHIPGVSGAVIKVSFFDNKTLAGNQVTSATSDEQGNVTIYGLAYGEYFLLETKAPAGYNLLENAVKLSIDGTTHTAEQTVTVENVSGSILPSTGGIGTTVFYVGGAVLLLAGCLLLLMKKREMMN